MRVGVCVLVCGRGRELKSVARQMKPRRLDYAQSRARAVGTKVGASGVAQRRAKLWFRDEGTSSQPPIPSKSCASQPQLSPLNAQQPASPPHDALVTTLRIPSSGVISIARPDYLPLDTDELDNDYRKSSHDPHHVHFRRCQRTLCPSKRLPRSLTRPCGTSTSSRDGTARLMVVSTGPPMVRTRIRCLLRCLPPALVIRCR